jgi:hypothetical protein
MTIYRLMGLRFLNAFSSHVGLQDGPLREPRMAKSEALPNSRGERRVRSPSVRVHVAGRRV